MIPSAPDARSLCGDGGLVLLSAAAGWQDWRHGENLTDHSGGSGLFLPLPTAAGGWSARFSRWMVRYPDIDDGWVGGLARGNDVDVLKKLKRRQMRQIARDGRWTGATRPAPYELLS